MSPTPEDGERQRNAAFKAWDRMRSNMANSYGIPPELERGLIDLFLVVAFPDAEVSQLTVLTCDPRVWMTNAPKLRMRLLDLSTLLGASRGLRGQPEARLVESVHSSLLRLGWKEDQITRELLLGKGERFYRPDIVLRDRTGKNLAVVEVKSSSKLLGD